MKKPEITFIIPCYKVENYLEGCIESILKQKIQDWEMILVDDGSPDRSGEIADKYAGLDQRIKAVHQNNQGVAVARNKALDLANGKWVWFVDSDDLITEDALVILSDIIRIYRCDTIFFGFRYISQDSVKDEYKQEILNASKKNVLEKLSCYINPSMLFSNDIIQKYHLRFSSGIRMAEDLEFQYKYLVFCNKPISIPNVLYIYQHREGSATKNSQSNLNNMVDCLKVAENLYEFAKEHMQTEEIWFSTRVRNILKSGIQASERLSSKHRHHAQSKLRTLLKEFNCIGHHNVADRTLKLAAFNINLYIICLRLLYNI